MQKEIPLSPAQANMLAQIGAEIQNLEQKKNMLLHFAIAPLDIDPAKVEVFELLGNILKVTLKS